MIFILVHFFSEKFILEHRNSLSMFFMHKQIEAHMEYLTAQLHVSSLTPNSYCSNDIQKCWYILRDNENNSHNTLKAIGIYIY
jgi:hypothetical protein